MKLHPDDPRISAYLLGELSADEAAAIELAAAADPAIRLALRDLENVQRILTNTLAPDSHSLLPHQREAIRRHARQADQAGKIVQLPSRRKSWKFWLAPLSAAALITLAVFILIHTPSSNGHKGADLSNPTPDKSWDQIPLEIALLPAPGPADASRLSKPTGTGAALPLANHAAARDAALAKTGDDFLRKVAERLQQSPPPSASALPLLVLRGSVAARTNPILPLPIHAGRASLGWITHAIRNEHKLPTTNAVRLEEILNHFTLRPVGPTATSNGVTIAAEALPCPWKPSATLLLISIRNTTDSPRDLTATFHADLTAVARYRLLGFAPISGLIPGPLPARLPVNASTTLAIELEPASTHPPLGSLEWSIDGKAATAIPLTRQPDTTPTADARFAALLCTYAQWLVHDQADLVNAALLSALAREYPPTTLAPDRADLITLITQSLALHEAF